MSRISCFFKSSSGFLNFHLMLWSVCSFCFSCRLVSFFTLFYFIILYWFCHTLTWIHHTCTCVPKHEPPSHLPPHNIPLGHPRPPAPSTVFLMTSYCFKLLVSYSMTLNPMDLFIILSRVGPRLNCKVGSVLPEATLGP